ncbi:MAG: hypothetical protein ABJF10_04055 [Chthoniobacter sp.]|uniref:hypothetical protein n=1 Tax=Chthoniobacter sp. TaxID=2510640 RepID=UPI0032A6ED98
MKTHAFFAVVALFWSLVSNTTMAKDSGGEVYAVVEIGASGVKGMVVQTLAENADPENPPVKMLKQYEPLDKNAFTAEAASRVGEAVAQMHKQMQDEFKVPVNHFYLVGSSGIPAEVKSAIAGKTFLEGATIEYIDAVKEATLVFRGIVPARRMSQVVLLDIGSGNSKGAYVEKTKPALTFTTYSIPWGTKTYAQEINKGRKDGSQFMVVADPLRKELILPAVQSAVRDFPGMQNLRRVYLAGGIPWAMATLLHPEEIGPDKKGRENSWVKLSVDDIAKFYNKATTDVASLLQPDLAGVSKENRQKAEEEVARVGKVFNHDQLTAGAQILKTFADEMHFDKKDALFFSRRALYAWPQGYILEKLSATHGKN